MLNAVQTRWTVDFDTPVASAMERQLQCVLPSGGSVSSVLCSSTMISSSSMDRGFPRPAFVVQAHEALGSETLAPLADRLAAGTDPLGNRLVVQATGAQKHDLGAAHQPGGQAARTHKSTRVPHGHPD